MTENLSSDPVMTEVIASAQTPWRTALQVPLLLIAAAGIGFAGQQVWQNRSDVEKLLGVSAVKVTACPSADSGCASTPAHDCPSVHSLTSCTSSQDDCCDAMLRAFEAAEAEPVSALSPANVVETL